VRRKTFDMILTAGGAVMVIVLVAAGSLALWGYTFASTNVHNELAAQKIYFPTQAQLNNAKPGTEVTPEMVPYLQPYAGQQVLDGQQAEAYANHYIAGHLQQIGGGLTYSQMSSAAMKLPKGSAAYTAAEAKVQTMFQGTTLRGLLLTTYSFWTFGQIALWAAVISFCLALVMLVLTLLGLLHFRRVPEDQMFPQAHRSNGHVSKVEEAQMQKV
jgi:hypothetical protein